MDDMEKPKQALGLAVKSRRPANLYTLSVVNIVKSPEETAIVLRQLGSFD